MNAKRIKQKHDAKLEANLSQKLGGFKENFCANTFSLRTSTVRALDRYAKSKSIKKSRLIDELLTTVIPPEFFSEQKKESQ